MNSLFVQCLHSNCFPLQQRKKSHEQVVWYIPEVALKPLMFGGGPCQVGYTFPTSLLSDLLLLHGKEHFFTMSFFCAISALELADHELNQLKP